MVMNWVVALSLMLYSYLPGGSLHIQHLEHCPVQVQLEERRKKQDLSGQVVKQQTRVLSHLSFPCSDIPG